MQYYDGWWDDHLDPEVRPYYADFKLTLAYIWNHLGLPEPTPAQYRMADYLQGWETDYDTMTVTQRETPDTGRAEIIMAFRGIGKSFITAAFVLWCLMRNPWDEKIMVASASSTKAKEFVSQVKGILMTAALFAHLRPREGQRNQADRFDVAGASISQSPSLKAVGITGQITGSRATRIVADDIEVVANSTTQEARETLLRIVNEFDAIKVPATLGKKGEVVHPAGDVIFLGTPQTLESIYLNLVKTRGFNVFCVPARVPKADKMESYTLKRDNGESYDILDPYISAMVRQGELKEWEPTDPQRFNEDDLVTRESRGRSWFMLQYMLDTSLSDAERYPLKTHDLIIVGTNHLKGPMTIQWGRDSDKGNIIRDMPNVGFSGDFMMRPLFVDHEWREYSGSVFFIDPSGRGTDETAWSHVKVINGMMYVIDNNGHNGDVSEAMFEIARAAQAQEARKIVIEPNFAAGVWINAFIPVLNTVWPGGPRPTEASWSKTQKEQRIIDTLEPVLNTHRLVVDEGVVRRDLQLKDKNYSLLYQLTHITRDRGSLRHDDRLDSLAGAVAELQATLSIDNQTASDLIKERELDEMLKEFMGEGNLGRGRRGSYHKRRSKAPTKYTKGARGTLVMALG